MPWDIWLIFFLLAVILPWRGRARMKKLLAMPQISAAERLALYASTIAFQWLAAVAVAWRAWAHRYSAGELGLTLPDRTNIAIASVVGAATIATLQWLNMRRVSRMPFEARGGFQAVAERLLPRTAVELLPYLGLSITAGLCEEFLYRGFAMAALRRAGLPVWSTVVLSSIMFGLAHLYQGRAGLVSTLAVGLVFGTSRLAYDSIVPVVFWHSAVDAVAGIAGPRYLLKPVPVTNKDKH